MSDASFGRRRKISIALSVVVTGVLAVGVWALLNFVTTRPQLRATVDLSRGQRFVVSDAMKAMIGQLREEEKSLKVDTYFLSPRDRRLERAAPMQQRLLDLTKDLLRRLEYFGGANVVVTHHDVYGVVTSQRAREMGLQAGHENSVKLTLGPRDRKLDLWRDLADIEIPEPNRQPGQAAIPLLRDYKGEEAIASALQSLMQEKDLIAYWHIGHYAADPRSSEGRGVSAFARELTSHGFQNKTIDLARVPVVPADCSVLILAGPEAAPGRSESQKILGWLRDGGRVLVTPSIIVDERTSEQPDFSFLLKELGLRLGQGWVFNGVADPTNPGKFQFGHEECARVIVRGAGLRRTHPVTERLAAQRAFVELHRARSIEIGTPPDGVLAEHFLTTNPKSWEVAVPVGGGRPSLAIPSETRPFHVGASVEIKSDREGARKGRLVVVSGMVLRNGGDPFLGRFAGKLVDVNRAFGVFLVNWLVREKRLVQVSGPRYRSRTMSVELPQIDRARTMLVWGLPGVFLFLSFFIVFWRRRA